MINLIPPDIRTERVYGRRNKLVLSWVAFSLVGIVVLAGIAYAGTFYIASAEHSAADTKTQLASSINSQKLPQIKAAYDSFASSLNTVQQILSKQVLFSSLIQQIGAVTPNSVTLKSITLTNSDNALSLDFISSSPDSASQIQANLEDPKNQLFDKADILQINCVKDEEKGTNTCTISVKVLFKSEASFLFLNSVTTGAKQ